MTRKLNSQAGESIAEVLVALLISVLGVMLMVGMIAASTKIVVESTTAMNAQFERANANVPVSGTIQFSDNDSTAEFAIPVDYYSTGDADESTVEVVFYTPARDGGESDGSEP